MEDLAESYAKAGNIEESNKAAALAERYKKQMDSELREEGGITEMEQRNRFGP
jgi:hypothetical protein